MLDTAKELNWSHMGVAARDMVVQPDRIVQSKRPEVGIVLIRPMNRKVQHHGASAVVNGLNGAFSQRVLEMGADTGEPEVLIRRLQIAAYSRGCEDAVVSMVCLDVDPTLCSIEFELMLGSLGVTGPKGHLMIHLDETGGGVYEDTTTAVLQGVLLSASGVGKAPADRTFIMVMKDELAWCCVTLSETVSTIGVFLTVSCSRWSPLGFG